MLVRPRLVPHEDARAMLGCLNNAVGLLFVVATNLVAISASNEVRQFARCVKGYRVSCFLIM